MIQSLFIIYIFIEKFLTEMKWLYLLTSALYSAESQSDDEHTCSLLFLNRRASSIKCFSAFSLFFSEICFLMCLSLTMNLLFNLILFSRMSLSMFDSLFMWRELLKCEIFSFFDHDFDHFFIFWAIFGKLCDSSSL